MLSFSYLVFLITKADPLPLPSFAHREVSCGVDFSLTGYLSTTKCTSILTSSPLVPAGPGGPCCPGYPCSQANARSKTISIVSPTALWFHFLFPRMKVSSHSSIARRLACFRHGYHHTCKNMPNRYCNLCYESHMTPPMRLATSLLFTAYGMLHL